MHVRVHDVPHELRRVVRPVRREPVRSEELMQKCPACHFRKTTTSEVRDPDTGEILGSQTVCLNCRKVIHQHWTDKGREKLDEN